MPKTVVSFARRIDSGRETIVGVNKYRLEKEEPLEILEVDNTAVREAQIKRLEKLRSERDEPACRQALKALTEAARTKTGNLLELSIAAALKAPRLRKARRGAHTQEARLISH